MSKGISKFVVAVALIACLAVIVSFGFAPFHLKGLFEDDAINKGLDLVGGIKIVYEADAEDVTDDQLTSVVSMMRSRLDNLGYTEGTVTKVGSKRVEVQIPNVSDTAEAEKKLGSTAKLEFKDYQDNVLFDGGEITNAKSVYGAVDNSGVSQYYVSLELSDKAKDIFSEKTEEISSYTDGNNYVAICLDGEVQSSPQVSEKITSNSIMITNPKFTAEQADWLAGVITSGQLPFALNVISSESISPQLGADAFDSSMLAAGIGILLVMLFMIVIYRLPGLVSAIALVAYVGIIALILVVFQINLSLPGIAGIVLSIGMSVDANVIIFERVKEELRLGKTPKSAVKSGFKRAFIAIFDSNVTTIIASVVLWIYGTGFVQGFAITLFIGVIVSMLSAILISRFLLNAIVDMNIKNLWLYGIGKNDNLVKGAK